MEWGEANLEKVKEDNLSNEFVVRSNCSCFGSLGGPQLGLCGASFHLLLRRQFALLECFGGAKSARRKTGSGRLRAADCEQAKL